LSEKVASKKDVRRQRRQEEKERRAARERRERLLIWGGAALVVVVVGFLALRALNPASQPGTAVLSQGNEHVDTLDQTHAPYNTVPPTSGPHMGALAPWGISAEPIPNEFQVHNLEDGGVVIQYDCPDDSCLELKTELTDFVTQLRADPKYTHLILAPYPGIRQTSASGGKPVALTAWARILYLDGFDRQKMLEFIDAYINIDHHTGGAG